VARQRIASLWHKFSFWIYADRTCTGAKASPCSRRRTNHVFLNYCLAPRAVPDLSMYSLAFYASIRACGTSKLCSGLHGVLVVSRCFGTACLWRRCASECAHALNKNRLVGAGRGCLHCSGKNGLAVAICAEEKRVCLHKHPLLVLEGFSDARFVAGPIFHFVSAA